MSILFRNVLLQRFLSSGNSLFTESYKYRLKMIFKNFSCNHLRVWPLLLKIKIFYCSTPISVIETMYRSSGATTKGQKCFFRTARIPLGEARSQRTDFSAPSAPRSSRLSIRCISTPTDIISKTSRNNGSTIRAAKCTSQSHPT